MEMILLAVFLGLALSFGFLSGFHNSSNIVATLISSRAMTSRAALWIASSAAFVGPFLFGVAVAETVGREVVSPRSISIAVVLASLSSTVLWSLVTWFLGMPSSSTHALIGAMAGAVFQESGWNAVHWQGLSLIGVTLLISPLIGFALGVLVIRVMLRLLQHATPRIDRWFKLGQLPTAVVLALAHGTNNAQKTMGVITLGMVVLGYQTYFYVPLWAVLASALAIALGTAAGGWRIITTMGSKFYRIRPVHSFTSQLISTVVILTSTIVGGPVSTTHVVNSSIVGVGAGQRRSQVHWSVIGEVLIAWLLTLPATAALAAGISWLLKMLSVF